MKKTLIWLLRLTGVAGLVALLLWGWGSLNHVGSSGEAQFIFAGTREDADCTILLNRDRCILIDTGTEADAPHILSLLEEHEVECIDIMILTNPDPDHVGGAMALMDALPIREIVVPYYAGEKELYNHVMDKADRMRVPVMVLSRDRQLVAGDLRLRVYPPDEFYYDKSSNYSLATLVQHRDVTLFLVGDAENKRLEEILRLKLPDETELYKVARHGRKSARSAELIEKLRPEYAVVTAEEPDESIAEALKQAGSQVCTTVGQDVIFTSDGTNLQCTKTRPLK